ncbi:MAG: mucoidy inhibitor MuiA family protein [Leptospiraceae bacterium]|nr:mucoidy inhibitor MuiA family protein [Leptospiraceae bacterium]
MHNQVTHKPGRYWSAFLILCVAPLALFGETRSEALEEETQSASAKVEKVVVYPDRALVTRSLPVRLGVGRHLLVFRDASPNLDPDSLRAFAGDTAVVIRGVNSWLERSSQTRNPVLRQLEESIEIIEQDSARHNQSLQRLQASAASLDKYREYLKQSIALNSSNSNQVQQWQSALVLLDGRDLQIRRTRQQEQEALQQNNIRLQKLKKQRAELWQAGRKLRRVIEVRVQTPRAIETRLGYSYVMRNAAWNVSYGMHYQDGQVQVEYYGNVFQQTGEDWQNVELLLSTARPAEGAARPRLNALALGAREAKSVRVYQQAETENERVADDGSPTTETSSDDTGGMAELKSAGNSMLFAIPRKYDIQSSSRSFRVKIASFALKPRSTTLRIVGYKQASAWLTCQLANNRSYPLLAGKIDVFRDSGFIGTSNLGHTPAGAPFMIQLGRESAIQLERHVERYHPETGVFGSGRLYRTTVTTKINNRAAETLTVEYYERMPVSETDDVKISMGSESDPAFQAVPDKPGIRLRQLQLAPKSTQKVIFQFEARVPESFPGELYGR